MDGWIGFDKWIGGLADLKSGKGEKVAISNCHVRRNKT
jgi:hypothetical protein